MIMRSPVPAVRFGVLGPVEAHGEHGPIPLKGARQRAVLARLIIARGRVVPVDQIVADLWDDPSDGAVGAIRTFVTDLRKALEPDRPPRQPATLLVTAPPGYALRTAPDTVDAWLFEAAVAESRTLPAGPALDRLDAALALWRGPAYPEWSGDPWARGEIERLDDLRLLAVERRAEALLDLGRAGEAVTGLRAHARARPLREDAWRLLAVALYRSGRQGEALGALRQARETLVAELGVDPGPGLRQLETDILLQAPHLTAVKAGPSAPRRRPFVGREEELARLSRLAGEVVRDGLPRLALIAGDAGGGKSALAEALTHRLRADGWATAWGHGPEYDGAAVAWPWIQIATALGAPELAGGVPAEDPAASRYQLHRAAVSLVQDRAARTPVLLVFDDLHHMDEGTLDLLAALLTEPHPVNGPVLILGTYRTTAITATLTKALARFARLEPVRVHLGGLPESAAAELVHAIAGPDLDAGVVPVLHRRSGGNPFFLRELARVLAAQGRAALDTVPPGVRDVIRHRVAQLPETAQSVLRLASVVGREVEPEVLAALSDDDTTVLDALDDAVRAGFLTEEADGLRFTHILVRDTLYGDLSALRRARRHAAVGTVIERLHPGDVAALAHHFGLAASRDTANRAARYARAAAEQAERRHSPYEAARLWQQAVTAHDRAEDDDVRGRLHAIMGLCRALAVTGRLAEARRHRAAAVDVADALDDPALTVSVLAAFDVPAIWTRNDDEELSERVVRTARRTLTTLPEDDVAQRGRLLSIVALESRGATDGRGHLAASEAEALARRDGGPALLAFALNAKFMHTFQRCGLAADRAAIGAELATLAARHELVTFEVLGHLILLQAHSALGDLTAADADAAAVERLAGRYDLPLAGLFTNWYGGLRLAVEGRRTEAADAYRRAAGRLRGSGITGMEDGLLPLALLSLQLGAVDSGPDDWRRHHDEWARASWGPYEPWVRPLILLAGGRRPEAAAALRAVPDSPHDLLREARACLTARAALVLGDRQVIRRTRAELAPADGELAGAGSGLLTFGPVAAHLRALATAPATR